MLRPWLAACLLGALPASAMALDLALYAELLREHTRETRDLASVRVDYVALRGDPRWKQLVLSLASSDPASPRTREERLAFWINAYNVLAIDLVVRHAPEGSIKDIGSFLSPVWKQQAGRIADKGYSLDDIEHGIVRPLGDPRVHVALICASLSCPPLLREPWEARRLDIQLDAQLRRWLHHEGKGMRIDRQRRTLYLSRIFDWFEDDFEASGGVLAFVGRYAPEPEAAWLRDHREDLRIRYLGYDWGLNAL